MVLNIASESLDTSFNLIKDGGDPEGNLFYFLLDKCDGCTLNADSLANLKTALIEKIKAEMPETAIRALDIEVVKRVLNKLIKSAKADAAFRDKYTPPTPRRKEHLPIKTISFIEAKNKEELIKLSDQYAKDQWDTAYEEALYKKRQDIEKQVDKAFEAVFKTESKRIKLEPTKPALCHLLKQVIKRESIPTKRPMPKPADFAADKYPLNKMDMDVLDEISKIAPRLSKLMSVLPLLEPLCTSTMEHKLRGELEQKLENETDPKIRTELELKLNNTTGQVHRDFNHIVNTAETYLNKITEFAEVAYAVSATTEVGNAFYFDEVAMAEAVARICKKHGIQIATGENSLYPKMLQVCRIALGKGNKSARKLAMAGKKLHESFNIQMSAGSEILQPVE